MSFSLMKFIIVIAAISIFLPNMAHGISLMSPIGGALSCSVVFSASGKGNMAFIGRHKDQDFKVWDPAVSDVQIHSLVDGSHRPSQGITMGIAKMVSGLLAHRHPSVEIYYFRKGWGTMYIGDGRSIDIVPGTVVYLPSNAVHYTISKGQVPIEAVYVFAEMNLASVKYNFDVSLTESSRGVVVHRLKPEDGNWSLSRNVDLVGRELDLYQHMVEVTTVAETTRSTTLFVESGEGSIMLNGNSQTLAAGSYVYVPANTKFSLTNTSAKEPLRVLEFSGQ